jgi:hypothetical protein
MQSPACKTRRAFYYGIRGIEAQRAPPAAGSIGCSADSCLDFLALLMGTTHAFFFSLTAVAISNDTLFSD